MLFIKLLKLLMLLQIIDAAIPVVQNNNILKIELVPFYPESLSVHFGSVPNVLLRLRYIRTRDCLSATQFEIDVILE